MQTDSLQIYENNKAEIDSQVATAKNYPRDEKKCIQSCIIDVTANEETAKACTYNVPKGDGLIGPSVTLARIIVQNMGNMRAQARVVEVTHTEVVSEAICFDLEKNYAYKVEVRRSIVGRNGRYSPDMISTTGNAANAIAFRNAVFGVIKKSIVDKVWTESKNRALGNVSDEAKFLEKRDKVLEEFKVQFGISESEILFFLKKKELTSITRDDLLTLIASATSIKEGELDADVYFRGKKTEEVMPVDNSRIITMIENVKNKEQLENLRPRLKTNEERIAFDNKFKSFGDENKHNQ